MSSYKGIAKTRKVFFCAIGFEDEEIFPELSQKIINHSPDGFSWGYGGSGPAQLALAIMLDCNDKQYAVALYQKFKLEFVATWPQDGDFEIPLYQIVQWVNKNLPINNENLASSTQIS